MLQGVGVGMRGREQKESDTPRISFALDSQHAKLADDDAIGQRERRSPPKPLLLSPTASLSGVSSVSGSFHVGAPLCPVLRCR